MILVWNKFNEFVVYDGFTGERIIRDTELKKVGLFLAKQCGIQISELEKATLTMLEKEHNSAEFGRYGTFIFSKFVKEYEYL